MYIAETWKETNFYLFPRIERRFITADDAEDGSERYWCPWCHRAVTPKEDSEHQRHFVHVCGEDCRVVKSQKKKDENNKKRESVRHKQMKAAVINTILDNNPNHTDNYGLEYWMGNRRPDAYVELVFDKEGCTGKSVYKVAIECFYHNWDDYSVDALNKKTDYYSNFNANTLWVVDFDDQEWEDILYESSKGPVYLGDTFRWFSRNYYNRIYGFHNNDIVALRTNPVDRKKHLYNLSGYTLNSKQLLLAKPKGVENRTCHGVKDIIAFSDY